MKNNTVNMKNRKRKRNEESHSHYKKLKQQINPFKVNIVCCGNPGVGKSTFLNCLMKERKFESGLSFGEGLTKIMQKHEGKDGNNYYDTPGLDDPKIRKKAAEAITKALRSGGKFIVLFFAVLEAGRVRPSDATTIKCILESVKTEFEYGIIINKVSDKVLKRLTPENKANIIACLNHGHRKTDKFIFVPHSDDLADEDNVHIELPAELKAFLQSILPQDIDPQDVEEIKTDEFEKMKREFEGIIKELKKDKDKLTKSFTELQDYMKKKDQERIEELDRLKKENKKALDSLKKKNDAQAEEERKNRLRWQEQLNNYIPKKPIVSKSTKTSQSNPTNTSQSNSNSGDGLLDTIFSVMECIPIPVIPTIGTVGKKITNLFKK